ncbi:MAG: glutathione S-transferase family protein [Gammaproteobacteria bacterium]|nr:glutathione S-transferase family protein [Gammaproteobacteria bacterium]
MYTLVIGNKNYSSWSLRPWVLMRTLRIDFKELLIPFAEPGSTELFRQHSPSGRVPCLHDGELRIWDSLAIVEYLAERHEGVWPAERAARAWARSAAAEMHSGFQALRNTCSMTCGQRVVLRERPAALERDLARLQALWQAGLTRFGGAFLGGQTFTGVDAFFAPVAFRLQTYHLSLDDPCDAYVARVLALPAMREWYEAALREPWREAAHERDIIDVAAEIIDLRQSGS